MYPDSVSDPFKCPDSISDPFKHPGIVSDTVKRSVTLKQILNDTQINNLFSCTQEH